jgi:hypothetical protein
VLGLLDGVVGGGFWLGGFGQVSHDVATEGTQGDRWGAYLVGIALLASPGVPLCTSDPKRHPHIPFEWGGGYGLSTSDFKGDMAV